MTCETCPSRKAIEYGVQAQKALLQILLMLDRMDEGRWSGTMTRARIRGMIRESVE